MKKSHLQILGAVVLVAVFGYQYMAKRGDSGPAKVSQGQFVVPAGTGGFNLGRLQFTPCELPQPNSAATTAGFCAPFSVAEDRSNPASRRIDLRLALIKSEASGYDDFVVILAGGPGQSAVETWPGMSTALAPLRKHRHVLLLDQRGTGESNPLRCPQQDEDDPALAFDIEHSLAQTRACLAAVSSHADPRFYTTSDAVADLEELRQALGGPKFDLVGVSYGTRVAQQYVMRHSDGVRSVVLDSAVPNSSILGQDFARNLDDALDLTFDACVADASCKAAFGDPRATLQRVKANLRAQPQQVRYADPVSFASRDKRLDEFGLAGLLRMFAYAPETAALLPLALAEAERANYAPMLGQMTLIERGTADLAGSGMQLSVICAEDADQLKVDPRDADTVLGTLMVEMIKRTCEVWPHGTRPADFHTPLVSATPILILAGERDPVTPPRYGEEILAGLSKGRLLVAKGQGHNVIGRGCIPTLVQRFVDDLDPATLDTSCADAIGPIPAFIDFNGAAP